MSKLIRLFSLVLVFLVAFLGACSKPGDDKKIDYRKLAGKSYNHGDSLINAGEPEAALIHLNKALELDSIFQRVHYQIGRAYYEMEEYEKAIPFFDQEVSLFPYHVEAVELKAECQMYLGNLKAALKDINHALRMGREKVGHAWYVKGMILFEMKEYGKAIKLHSRAIRVNSSTPEFYVKRAIAFGELGKFQEMLTDAEMALKLDSVYTDAFHIAAFANERQGNQEQAVYYNEKATALEGSENAH